MAEVLPNAIQMGIRISEFWDLTMAELDAYGKGYKQMKEEEFKYHDQIAYLMSCYMLDVESIALHNQICPMFSKNVKRIEYRKQSISQEMEERKALENMTVEEKIKYTERLFNSLSIMQHNYEKDHPKNESTSQSS